MSEAEEKKNLVQLIQGWPLPRKLALAGAALACVALFAGIILQARQPEYKLLYGNLAAADAATMVERLKEQKIPYRLEDGGRAIHIPAERVYETRLTLAGSGLPQGEGVGFEIFDRQSFGVTDFAQKINYQRALQGELARTIASLAPVEAARVHLVLPAERLFRDQQQPATASVILKLVPGRDLGQEQIQGIVNLVAGSIEGLSAEQVTVIDANGRILSRHREQEFGSQATQGMLDYQQTLERRLEIRAQSLLDRALGPGNSQVQVTAVVDFAQQEQTEERYDPDGTVVRSEQLTVERSGSETAGGIPGVDANLGGRSGGAETLQDSRSEETVNYEVSKVVSRKVFPVGTVQQLSVAVLVAQRRLPGAAGQQPAWEPRSAEELQSIENMIRSALGLEVARGDQLAVVSLPFEDIFAEEPQAEPPAAFPYAEWLPGLRYGLGGVAVLALGLLLLGLRQRRRQRLEELVEARPMKTVAELERELEGAQEQAAALETERELAMPAALETEREEEKALPPPDPLQLLREEALREHVPFAQIIRTWLKEG